MWMFLILAIVALGLLINPKTRKNEKTLKIACAATFIAMWLEKGLGLVIAGFIPNPLNQIREYSPTIPELTIALGVWATGFFILTVLYKIAISVKEENAA
jgi:molybdopterin-containing oxidoreductase family membrane subunit